MKILLLKIAVLFLKLIYFFIKLFPTKQKITFISRQSDHISLDFSLLSKQIESDMPDYQIIILAKRLTQEDNIFKKIRFCFHILLQMYHIATSRLVILDSYCLPISVLKHKSDLKVIQMWHSIGTMKKFGYSILDKQEGSKYKVAQVLKMHHNYDYVLCSSKAYQSHLEQGFHIDPSKIVILPLPRLDILKDKEYRLNIEKSILKKYPKLNKRKTILYAPTFRKNYEITKEVEELINNINFERYNLVIKLHPLDQTKVNDDRVIVDSSFSTLDMLFVSDYVISDYSCFIYEAIFLNKPIFLYNFDMKNYMKSRDVYIDYNKDIPFFKSSNSKSIIKAIENKDYSEMTLKEFKEKYIDETEETFSKRIVDFIKQILD